jgi:hypothetical protein
LCQKDELAKSIQDLGAQEQVAVQAAMLLLDFQGVQSTHHSLAMLCPSEDPHSRGHFQLVSKLGTDLLLLTCSTPSELLSLPSPKGVDSLCELHDRFQLLVHTPDDVTVPMECTNPKKLLQSSTILQSQLRRAQDANKGGDGRATSPFTIIVDGPYETWQEITYHSTDEAVCDHFIPLLTDAALVAAIQVTAAYKLHSLFARYSLEAGRRLNLDNVAAFLATSLQLNHHWLYVKGLQCLTTLDNHTIRAVLTLITKQS